MKLIDKDKVVAEIEKRIKELQDLFKEDEKKLDSFQKTAIHLCIDECKVVLNILDTIETKEMDSIWNDARKTIPEDLTWEDIREIYIIFAEIDAEIEFCKTDIQGETIGYYQEALKRFKSIKEGIKL